MFQSVKRNILITQINVTWKKYCTFKLISKGLQSGLTGLLGIFYFAHRSALNIFTNFPFVEHNFCWLAQPELSSGTKEEDCNGVKIIYIPTYPERSPTPTGSQRDKHCPIIFSEISVSIQLGLCAFAYP